MAEWATGPGTLGSGARRQGSHWPDHHYHGAHRRVAARFVPPQLRYVLILLASLGLLAITLTAQANANYSADPEPPVHPARPAPVTVPVLPKHPNANAYLYQQLILALHLAHIRHLTYLTRLHLTHIEHLIHLAHLTHLIRLKALAAEAAVPPTIVGGTAPTYNQQPVSVGGNSAPLNGSGEFVSPYNYSGFERCVVIRESSGDSQVMNSTGHYGLFQFDLPTWISGGGNPGDFGHASVAEQNRVFTNVFAMRGVEPWRPSDGC